MEHITQVEIPAPSYKTVSEQILNLAMSLKEGGNDQDTIRCALQVFAQSIGPMQANPSFSKGVY